MLKKKIQRIFKDQTNTFQRIAKKIGTKVVVFIVVVFVIFVCNQQLTINKRTKQQIQNYVALSTTLGVFRRPEDYDFLTPLTALNWFENGFIPIIFVVATDPIAVATVQELYSIVLPPEAIVMPIIIKQSHNSTVISVSQIIRHYAALLVSELNEESYIRITDADMMIFDASPFLPPADKDIGIDIYNGNCCLKSSTMRGFEHECSHYPMHSIGMKVSLWRELFWPLNMSVSVSPIATSTITKQQALNEIYRIFIQFSGNEKPDWYIDQNLAGCVIANAVANNITTLNLGRGPYQRIHTGDKFQSSKKSSDVHLAEFAISKHSQWFEAFLNDSHAIGSTDADHAKYKKYYKAWQNK